MRPLTAARGVAVLLLLGACASPGGGPPGGPADPLPPELVSVSPDSGATGVDVGAVAFRFDEVVSERPSGGGQSLADLFMISPSRGDVRVRWRRERLDVRPTDGFRENTAYTITLLPGLADLRGNVRNQTTTVVFSTGATIPATRLAGAVFAAEQGTPLAGALVEAITGADSVTYRTRSDSGGRFTLVALQPGRYLVRAFEDRNRDREAGPNEAWDSTTVTLADTLSVELYAFVRDTVGTRLERATVAEDGTLRLRFDRALRPTQSLDSIRVTVTAADSTTVQVSEVAFAPADTGVVPAPLVPLPPRDTAAADTAAPPPLPPARPTRPTPPRELVVRLARPLAPETSYRIRVEGAQNLLGYSTGTETVLTTPAAPPPAADTLPPAPADTARPRGVTPRPLIPPEVIRRPATPPPGDGRQR